ncbi:hypothetical protein C8Q74DRAFT_449729 [Fomes fomentarius]|nr:hypothetical protein C8Q74DRAFT_449729 [Fomes fomentarius]
MLLLRIDLVASSDTVDQNGITPRPPPPHNPGHSHSSSAISAAVGTIFALLIAAAIWRCIVFFRRYRRNTARRLATSGSVSKPHLHEVRLVHVSPCSYRGTRWEGLRPLAAGLMAASSPGDGQRMGKSLPSCLSHTLYLQHTPTEQKTRPRRNGSDSEAHGASKRRRRSDAETPEDHSESQSSSLCLFRVLRELWAKVQPQILEQHLCFSGLWMWNIHSHNAHDER